MTEWAKLHVHKDKTCMCVRFIAYCGYPCHHWTVSLMRRDTEQHDNTGNHESSFSLFLSSSPYHYSVCLSAQAGLSLSEPCKNIQSTRGNSWDVTPRFLPVLMVTFRRRELKRLYCLMAISCAQRQLGKVNTAWPGTQYVWACEINGFSPMQRQYLICSSPILLHTIYRLIVPVHAAPSLGVCPGKMTPHMFAGWYEVLHVELQPCVNFCS